MLLQSLSEASPSNHRNAYMYMYVGKKLEGFMLSLSSDPKLLVACGAGEGKNESSRSSSFMSDVSAEIHTIDVAPCRLVSRNLATMRESHANPAGRFCNIAIKPPFHVVKHQHSFMTVI